MKPSKLKTTCCLWLVPGLLVAALLAGCSTPTLPPGWEQKPAAQSAFDRGEYALAAQAWEQQAATAETAEAARLRIRAANAWLLAGDPVRAAGLLRRAEASGLAPEDRALGDLVRADLALRANRPDEAQLLLERARPALPSGERARHQALYDQATQMLASPAPHALSQAARISSSMTSYDPAAAVRLLQTLETVPSGQLETRVENPGPEPQLNGWLDLALAVRRNLAVPDGITADISRWKRRHPGHLLSETQALDTWLRYRQLFTPPFRVAVLLPGSGRLKGAGEAMRDGMMGAYLNQPGGAEIRFYPTGDDPQSAVSAYFGAVDAGADLIVGPVQRESVRALLALAGMSTPLLALNDLPADLLPPAGLEGQVHGMSLSQTAEVEAVAHHAWNSGYDSALVLAPENAWGERMAGTFQGEFLQQGGKITASLRYPEAENDHGALLQRALKIDESKARKRLLEKTLQMPLEFEPVRRKDIDVIFIAATPAQARLLRPQLRFYDAEDIPVYATGRVYSGQPDPAHNIDLDGIRFPTTPWSLAHAARGSVPDLDSLRQGRAGALFALGQDAWNLLPWLGLMGKDPEFSFPGQSGSYTAGGRPMLSRQPAWAVFRHGLPTPLPAPPERPPVHRPVAMPAATTRSVP